MTDAATKKPHVPPVDETWLALRPEVPAVPPVPIVDSHIHLWDFSDPPYFGDSYRRDARPNGIEAAVFVECSMGYRAAGPEPLRVAGEAAFAADQARRHSAPGFELCAAIVGAADLGRGAAVAGVLEALAEAAGGRLRGIRTRAAHDPDPAAGYGAGGPPADLLARPEYRAGVRALQAAGLSLDIYAFHTQLGEVAGLAAAFPSLPIIVNHLGGPLGVGRYADRPEAVFRDWTRGIETLARQENVFLKLGGFAISRIGLVQKGPLPPDAAGLAEVMRPWIETCLAAFGPGRCMFGSNFPVDKAGMSLTVLVNAMRRLTAEMDEGDRRAVLGGTARKAYRI